MVSFLGRYQNWNPSVSYKLGDCGSIDRASGGFSVQGNIFEGDFATAHADRIAALATVPEDTAPIDYQLVTSDSVREITPGGDITA